MAVTLFLCQCEGYVYAQYNGGGGGEKIKNAGTGEKRGKGEKLHQTAQNVPYSPIFAFFKMMVLS